MRDPRSVGRPRTDATLDRTPQILPVPLGGLAPARHQSPALLWWWRRHQPTVLTAIALAAIGLAVWVSTTPRTFTVAVHGGEVNIDGEVLIAAARVPANPTRVFTGRAALAVTAVSAGTARAGAVMMWNGLAVTGHCVLHLDGTTASDACEFTTERGRLTSVDTFDFGARVWHRQYQDGIDVTIAVPAGTELIPIPFPLGQ